MLRHPHLSHLIPTPQPPSATLFPYTTLFRSNEDGSARYMPAGVRVLEKSLLREYATDEVVACFPDDLDKFIGPKTRVVAVSTHNPLGVTFAAGVYTSIYGYSKEPLNSIYTRVMFDKIRSSPYRKNFQVVVGG